MSSTDADAITDLIVGQDSAEGSAPVDHRLAEVGQTVVHQYLSLLLRSPAPPLFGREGELLALGDIQPGRPLLLQMSDQLGDGSSLSCLIIIIGVEEADEDPLRPLVVLGVGGADLT